MNVTKVVKCKIVSLTNVKRKLLEEEFNNFQKFLHGNDSVKLYSAYKQQGKRFNKIVSNIPFHELSRFIEYKANWLGIKVVKVSERGTSKYCHKCGSIGRRPTQGLFKCSNCGLQYNADLNGALNIFKVLSYYMFENWVTVTRPLTLQV